MDMPKIDKLKAVKIVRRQFASNDKISIAALVNQYTLKQVIDCQRFPFTITGFSI